MSGGAVGAPQSVRATILGPTSTAAMRVASPSPSYSTRVRVIPRAARGRRRQSSDAEVQAELDAARPTHGCAAEERALQQILLVEHVVDEELRAQHRASEDERIAQARVEDRARWDVDPLVEVEQTRAVAAVAVGRVHAVGEAAA